MRKPYLRITDNNLRILETQDEAIIRLATEARRRHVRILPTARGFEAFDPDQPQRNYHVTLLSCDCRTFIALQRCAHHSALLAHMNQLPSINQPATLAA